jgi:hypothetical protein
MHQIKHVNLLFCCLSQLKYEAKRTYPIARQCNTVVSHSFIIHLCPGCLDAPGPTRQLSLLRSLSRHQTLYKAHKARCLFTISNTILYCDSATNDFSSSSKSCTSTKTTTCYQHDTHPLCLDRELLENCCCWYLYTLLASQTTGLCRSG